MNELAIAVIVIVLTPTFLLCRMLWHLGSYFRDRKYGHYYFHIDETTGE